MTLWAARTYFVTCVNLLELIVTLLVPTVIFIDPSRATLVLYVLPQFERSGQGFKSSSSFLDCFWLTLQGLFLFNLALQLVKLATTKKVFLHACVLACKRLKLGNRLYLIYFS